MRLRLQTAFVVFLVTAFFVVHCIDRWMLDTRFLRRVNGSVINWQQSRDNTDESFNNSLSIHFVWVSRHLGAGVHGENQYMVNYTMLEEWEDPRWPVTLWTDALVREHFPELVPTLERLQEPAWIADIVRYHVIDRFGGLFLDTDFSRLDGDILQLWKETHGSFAVCQDIRLENAEHCNSVANGVFASTRNSPVLKCAKHIAIFNTLTALNAGKTAFEEPFTGPTMWSRCVLAHDMTVLQPFTFFPCPYCWGWWGPYTCDRRACANLNFCRGMPHVYAQHLGLKRW